MVKLADRITNLQPPPEYWDDDRIERYREEGNVILNELGAGCDFLAERLGMKINAYE